MKKRKVYEGNLNKVLTNKIYLNINHLEKGFYKLNLVNKNKIIKRIHFTKK